MGWWRRLRTRMHEKYIEQLLAACQHGVVDAAKGALDKGVNINARHQVSGRTALMECARNGHLEVAKVLLARGANVNARSRIGGRTALMKASESGHVAMAKVLLNHLAEIDEQDNFGKTALMLAAKAGHTALVKHLIKNGADPEFRDYSGKSALDCAAVAGRNDVVKLLADYVASSRRGREKTLSAVDTSGLDAYYAVLECDKSDSIEHIKRQYRKLVKDFHPDTIQGKGLHDDFVRFANQKFQDIEEAYRRIMLLREL